MGFSAALKALVLVQLSVLLLSCSTTVFGEQSQAVPPIPPRHHGYYHHPAAAPAHPPGHHHHHHHPAAAPAHPPSHHHHHHPHPHPPTASPVHPPVHSPTHAPAHPPGHHHHHGHPPAHSPTHAPAQPPSHHAPPAHPPSHHSPPAHPPSPTHPPFHPPKPSFPPKRPFPRSFVAVQGVVFVKSCKYYGVSTLLGASPVLGATVKLQCNNTKYPLVVTAKTDKNGYFFITAPKTITTFGAHKCKASLVSAPPTAGVSKPSDLHGGLTGSLLRPEKPFSSNKLPFLLFTVGPFAFEPKCPH